jgi:hypothetical protein
LIFLKRWFANFLLSLEETDIGFLEVDDAKRRLAGLKRV